MALACLNFSGCFSASSNAGKNKSSDKAESDYQNPQTVGKIASGEITESSGLAASLCQENVFWTHNDSGNKAHVFALNSKGEKLGTWKVAGAENDDWEDMTAFKNEKGECFLYVGDIGNNDRTRGEFVIYVIKEPKISDADKSSSAKSPLSIAAAEKIKFEYPDMRHDAETLMIHPQTGDLYVLSKRMSGAAGVYKLAANYSLEKTNTLKKIADFSVPAIPNGFLTGGGISPDGRRAVICDYYDAYEIALPEKEKNFDEIWKQKISVVKLGKREQGEAVSYSRDGKSIFATSENKNSPIIEVKRK
jgi:hypothetical protein